MCLAVLKATDKVNCLHNNNKKNNSKKVKQKKLVVNSFLLCSECCKFCLVYKLFDENVHITHTVRSPQGPVLGPLDIGSCSYVVPGLLMDIEIVPEILR